MTRFGVDCKHCGNHHLEVDVDDDGFWICPICEEDQEYKEDTHE